MKKILFLVTVGFAMLFAASCSDDDPKELSKQEAESVLSNVNTEMSQTMGQMMETEGMIAMNSFMSLTSYFGTQKSTSFQFLNPIRICDRFNNTKASVNELLKAPKIEGQGFVFEEWIGTWEWLSASQIWKYTANETNRIVFKYPSTPQSTTNDATLTISNYEAITIGTEVVPTSISVTLAINGVSGNVLSIVYDAEFSSEGLPQMLSLNVTLSQFSLTALASVQPRTNDMILSFSHQLKNQSVVAMSSNIEAIIPNATQFDPNAEYVPSSVKGFLQIGSLKITADLNVLDFVSNALNGTPSAIETAANNNLKVVLYTYPQNNRIAWIKWKYNINYNPESDDIPLVPYIVFSDGSEALLETYFNSLDLDLLPV